MYKTGRFFLPIFFGIIGCRHENRHIISSRFIDSLIVHYQEPVFAKTNDADMQFWKNRINPSLPGITSESKYAGTLGYRFHLFGNIRDIQCADSIMRKLDSDFNHKEAGADLILIGYSILQHQFKAADDFLEKAKRTGIKRYDFLTASFDVDFELGRYFNATNELKELSRYGDYGYFFRRSKMDHLNGMLDSSIHAMAKAADLEKGSAYLEQAALSNTADLYIHSGELEKAAELYRKCILLNSADFHSMMGMGWIALEHDQNDSLAEKIFIFVQSKNKLPDPMYKLTQMAQSRRDLVLENKFARGFAAKAADTCYGNMYAKYLIELYTGILHDPSRAEAISKRELENRSTPQTFAWYAWSLFANNKKRQALDVFQKNVSGKPLEGLELYWMGKIMQGLNKGYNAQAFYKAAYINKYDLSPGILRDLEEQLD